MFLLVVFACGRVLGEILVICSFYAVKKVKWNQEKWHLVFYCLDRDLNKSITENMSERI